MSVYWLTCLENLKIEYVQKLSKSSKRTDRELFSVNCEVDRVLRNESYIRSRLYSLIDIRQTDHKRNMKIRNNLWNKKLLLPSSEKSRKSSDKSFIFRKMELRPIYDKSWDSEYLQNYPLDLVVQSAPPRLTSDQLPTVNMKSGRQLFTARNYKSRKNEIFTNDNNKKRISESVLIRPKEQGKFVNQWRPESNPLSWRDIKFTNINSEARGKSRNRLCGAFNATSFQLIYGQQS
ncbi:unnamed protein product [Schistosoma turkestanicum]|nr:unnamed protein product [Schistosoma turkestanicum]